MSQTRKQPTARLTVNAARAASSRREKAKRLSFARMGLWLEPEISIVRQRYRSMIAARRTRATLPRLWRALVGGVGMGMPVRIGKVDNIDGPPPGFNQRNVIILNLHAHGADERTFAQPFSSPPHPVDNFRSCLPRERLDRQLEIPVTYHVHQNGHFVLLATPAPRKFPRPEEVVLQVSFLPVVLAVEKDNIYAHRGGNSFENGGNFQKHGHP